MNRVWQGQGASGSWWVWHVGSRWHSRRSRRRSSRSRSTRNRGRPRVREEYIAERASDAASCQQKEEDDQQQNAEAAARVVSPSGCIGPGWKRQNQQRDYEGQKQSHVTPPAADEQ